jgi:hypothetical protein
MTIATPANPLSYNGYVQTIASLAVVLASESNGVFQFVDAPLQTIAPQMLSYAELRISRDLDLLSSQTSNTYTLTAGQNVFSLPVNDFQVVNTVEIVQTSGNAVVNSTPLLQVSKEFIQNCCSGLSNAGTPQYYAMYGSNFGDEQDVETNILLGPPPNYGYGIRITGSQLQPSLYQNAVSGIADTEYTYISAYYPDLLVMASMIFVSAYQRNFSATSDSPDMGQSYEKQYQALRLGAIPIENRRKGQASGWSSYSTPTAATPTR